MNRTVSRRIAGTVAVLACTAGGFAATAAPASAATGKQTNSYACSGSMYQATNYATDARGEAEGGKNAIAFRKFLDATQLGLTDGNCAPFVTPAIQANFDTALGALQNAKNLGGANNWSQALGASQTLESATRALYSQLPAGGNGVGVAVPIRTADADNPSRTGCAATLNAARGYTDDAVFDAADIFKIPGTWTWTYFDDFTTSLDATQTRLTNGACASFITPEMQVNVDRALQAAQDGSNAILTGHGPEATADAKSAQSAMSVLVAQFSGHAGA
jgi:hypothetical protein